MVPETYDSLSLYKVGRISASSPTSLTPKLTSNLPEEGRLRVSTRQITDTMLDLIRTYLSLPYVLLALFALSLARNYAAKISRNHRIARLGARAPVRTTYLPYGVDFLYEVLRFMTKDKNLELWVHTFKTYGFGRYTVESDGAERVILTADPENIKAILATQFKEFGKGEAFRLDWHAFLGDSEYYFPSVWICVR